MMRGVPIDGTGYSGRVDFLNNRSVTAFGRQVFGDYTYVRDKSHFECHFVN